MTALTTFAWVIFLIVILLLSVTIHEFGHFLALKKMKVYVYEFAIGFGPTIYSWGKKETKYSIRLLPLGGYVIPASKLSQEVFDHVIIDHNRTVDSLPLYKKLFFCSAGIAMNLLVAFLLTFLYFAFSESLVDINSYSDYLLTSATGFFVGIGRIFTGDGESFITIITTNSGSSTNTWGISIVLLLVSVNFNLVFFNMIPFPPLDGWRVAEYVYEKIMKREITEKWRTITALFGVSVLIIFTIFVFIAPYVF